MSIPCPTRDCAELIERVISVDRELRPYDVTKTFRVDEDTDGVTLNLCVGKCASMMGLTLGRCALRRCDTCVLP